MNDGNRAEYLRTGRRPNRRRREIRRPYRSYDSLRITRQGGRRDVLDMHPETAQRIQAYLRVAGHGSDLEGPLFRTVKHGGVCIRVLSTGSSAKHARAVGPGRRIFRVFDAGHVHHHGARKTELHVRKCKRPHATAILAPQSFTTAGASIQRSGHRVNSSGNWCLLRHGDPIIFQFCATILLRFVHWTRPFERYT